MWNSAWSSRPVLIFLWTQNTTLERLFSNLHRLPFCMHTCTMYVSSIFRLDVVYSSIRPWKIGHGRFMDVFNFRYMLIIQKGRWRIFVHRVPGPGHPGKYPEFYLLKNVSCSLKIFGLFSESRIDPRKIPDRVPGSGFTPGKYPEFLSENSKIIFIPWPCQAAPASFPEIFKIYRESRFGTRNLPGTDFW